MSAPIEPLSSEIADELLSAELDGDFDAAAREHGYAPAIARELLAADPATEERRAALAAARDTIAVPPLPPAERARILDAAVTASGDDLASHRARRAPTRVVTIIAAVAAVIALIVGVGAALTRRGDHSGSESSAAGSARDSSASSTEVSNGEAQRETAASAPTYDFGVAANDQQLRALVEAALPSATARSSDSAPASQFGGQRIPGPTASSTRDDCVRAQVSAIGLTGPVLLRGPVTYKGTGAELFLYADGGATVALVIDDSGEACRLLSSQLLRPGS